MQSSDSESKERTRKFRNPLGLGSICCLALLSTFTARGTITGQWDFDGGLDATVGQPLQYRGSTPSQSQFGTTAFFGIAPVGGQIATVMQFPATAPSAGYIMNHGASPNGGGSMVNQYTVIMDVLFPSSSSGFRALWQTDTNNTSDAEVFANGTGGIGISSVYQGILSADTWHRIVLTFDLTKREFGKYIDGSNVLTAPDGEAPLGSNPMQYLGSTSGGIDQRWALGAAALLFSDDDNETGLGYVNSVQFQDRVLSAGEIAALGMPVASGIPGGDVPGNSGVAQYDFNGNLQSSTGGSALSASAAAPASEPGVAFTTAMIAGQQAQVASFTRGTFFRMTHGLSASSSYLDQYTLVADIMFPSRPSGWAALWQTSTQNANDADWFINSSSSLGISGVYGGTVADGTWNRVALVVDAAAGTFTSYLNGSQVQQITGVSPQGRWSLDATALLFADEDQENAAGFVNSVQLRGTALSAEEIASLGGPQASGIPIPQGSSNLKLVSPNGGEVLQAGMTQTISWTVMNPAGLLQIDLLLGNDLYRTITQAAMRQSNYLWNIDPLLGDTNAYRFRITSINNPALQDLSDSPFSVTGSGVAPNPVFGRQLQTNGGFEMQLTNWQVVAGHPVALTGAQAKGSPYSGTRFLHGGLNPAGDAVVRQDIDLLASGFIGPDLDSGAALDAEAWLRTASGSFDDHVYMRVGFLNADHQELASARTMVASGAWVRRPLSAVLPSGTRHLGVEIVGKHRRDLDNDSMADEVVIRLQRAWPLVSPQITKLPLLQDYRQDAMTLFWETDGNKALHAVEWGRAQVTEHSLANVETLQIDSTHFVHRATLTGLTPETTYVYRVRSGASVSATYSFRTAPLRETPFKVAWWADSQYNPSVLQQMIPHMVGQGIDWMGVAGDLANDGGSLSDWHNYWFKPLETLNLGQTHPAIFARGNHDGENPYSYAYSALPGNEAWFAFNYGNSRFIFLDTEASSSAVPEQYSWLAAELAKPETQNAAFRVVCFHRLPYANLWNGGGYTGETWVRNDWVPLFRQFNVDAVINGHAHNYNRGVTNGVTYLVVGGGGGALDTERVASWPLFTVEYSQHHYGLMSVDGDTLDWHTYNNAGQLLDSFSLSSRVPRLHSEYAPGASQISLSTSGKPGVSYVVESSADLTSWIPILTNSVPTTGDPSFSSLLKMTGSQGYFRVRAL